ncbi:MAG: ABC transporter permease [Clostridia bacterium]|nr:ABC transporter permease [Clostridia bacterium]
MNKILALTKRNLKEILRDKLSLIFCLIFPIALLVILQLVFLSIEYVPDNFKIESYAVGICVFGFTFDMLFASMMVAGDKNTEFINRIKMAPISKATYYTSFLFAILPIAFIQCILFFVIAFIFKLPVSFNIVLASIYLIPSAIFYITLGIFIGYLVKNEKQSGPVSSIIISFTGMFGGVFMPIDNMGKLTTVANLLPFPHTLKIASGIFMGNNNCFFPHAFWVLGYTAVIWLILVLLLKRKK